MRLAVVSTPRSGNTWLRGLLSSILDCSEFAVHLPGDLDWANLPPNCVVQIHWYPTREFQDLLREHRFEVVSIMRHPLDVLLSILQFSQREPETARWLDGRDGDERCLSDCTPVDQAFTDYATGHRFRSLIDVSARWVGIAHSSIRYEELLADPTSRLTDVLAGLGANPSEGSVRNSVEARQIANMRPTSSNGHYWRGMSGGWRDLLPSTVVGAIEPSLSPWLTPFNYSAHTDLQLTEAEAELRYLRLLQPFGA